MTHKNNTHIVQLDSALRPKHIKSYLTFNCFHIYTLIYITHINSDFANKCLRKTTLNIQIAICFIISYIQMRDISSKEIFSMLS